ncbi:MAG: nuclear transport factor 2 family protein [Chitinophagaceae bacterium]|nr:MAG: nuclear transport factor 2 family protein [Chitinophagaceae bacterium]
MKKITIALVLLCYAGLLYAQNKNTENEIRALEQIEVKAVLEKDSAMLLKLWHKDFVVNNPDNVVVFPGKTTLDRPVLRQSRASFAREVEQVIVNGDVVFSMGSETVIPSSGDNVVGQPIKRRYTNIWIKENGTWRLVARHANIICQNK